MYLLICIYIGRLYHTGDMSLGEEARAQQLEELLASDPEQEALRGINEDSALEPYEANWIVKSVGDSQVFTKDDGTTT